jgi:hypothetical protein
MAVGAIVARILTQYSDKGSKAAQKDIAKLGKNIDSFAKKSTKAFGLAAAASAAFAIKIGKDAVQAAIADQKSQVLLANSLRNTADASDIAIAGVEKYVTALQKQFSVVDDDLRPAMARLTAATGSISAAQSLMQTALDVSASSGANLEASVSAIIKATSGQFKGLKQLVPGLSNATIKSKDFAKALAEVNKETSGAAAKRAGTLEYRLAGLRIAFGEILESLGYALIPVLEKFATIVTTKILPALDSFVQTNQTKLVASFTLAANAALVLLNVSISFSNWIVNNMGIVKSMALLIAGMFVVGRISAFIIMLGTLTTAMALLRTTAAGAAVATAFATGGVSVGTAVTALAGLAALGLTTKNLFNMANGKAPASGGGGSGSSSMFNPYGTTPGSSAGVGSATSTIGGTDGLSAFLAALNKNTTATNKNTKSIMDIATANAMKELAARQKALSGGSSIAIGGGSKIYSTRNDQGKIDVNVYAGNVVGSADALIEVVQEGLANSGRRNGVPRGALGPDRLIA